MTFPRCGEAGQTRPVVAVIDGQGGGFGVALIKELRMRFGEALEVWALGTNSSATSAMMKAKANRGATGENALLTCLPKVDAVMGPIAVTWANAMMGEITPAMAAAVMSVPAPKVLIPLSQEGVTLAGFKSEPLPHLVGEAISQLARLAGAAPAE
ncbi:hypothetical protein C4J81_12840 [Deltaproteobacteria bacterium Smac51]|nr:hypothetical protein C4J81_12840 [Deltaproteobacteria bacterium Smac51]